MAGDALAHLATLPAPAESALRSADVAVLVAEVFQRLDLAPERGAAWDAARHALKLAVAARRVAERAQHAEVSLQDAFAAGLLSKLGTLALAASFPKSWQRITAQVSAGTPQVESERALLGTDHVEAGLVLAGQWNMPMWVSEAIEHDAADGGTPAVSGVSDAARIALRAQSLVDETTNTESSGAESLLDGLDDEVDQLIARIWGAPAPADDFDAAITRATEELKRPVAEPRADQRLAPASTRYFRALTQFDQQLTNWGDPAAVVSAMTRAAMTALQCERIAAFGVRENSVAIDVAWLIEQPAQSGNVTQSMSPELARWLREPSELSPGIVVTQPAALRGMLQIAHAALGTSEARICPVVRQGRLFGGLLLPQCVDDARERHEMDELSAVTEVFGLALQRANAYAAALRLADELAENNGRLQQAQHEMLRTRSLSMIAEMAAGAGHELNNPLTVISGRAQVLLDSAADPAIRRGLEQILDKAHECSRVVSEMMEFARPPAPQLARVDVGRLLVEARAAWLAKSGLPPSRLRLEVGPGDYEVSADREQLKSVIMELLENAREAVAENRGSISIGCTTDGDGNVEILVADTGGGMSATVLGRAFDPFFSHRRAGRGRGLGLPRAARIMESHRGKIWLDSQPDQGTRAHVSLPALP